MKKKILLSVLLGALVLPLTSLATMNNLGAYGSPLSIRDMLPGIETATWIIFTVIVLVCFVVAGVLFLTALGEPEKIKTAKSAFIWGIAGVAVGILAFTIETIVASFL